MMFESISTYIDNHFWSSIAATAVLVIALSGFADRRRAKRSRIENVGFMPWAGITVLATMIGILSTALAIKTEFLS